MSTQRYSEADFLDGPSIEDDAGALQLIAEGLLLNEHSYAAVRDHKSPMLRGLFLLLIIIIAVSVAQAVGLAFGVLISPRIDIIQDSVYDGITQMRWFVNRSASVPEFLSDFRVRYEMIWQAIRILGRYPSWLGAVTYAGIIAVITVLDWLVYGFLAHWLAKWYGGRASYSQFMGALALSYAPLSLLVILCVPGAWVAAPVVLLFLIACKHVAVKAAHRLDSLSSLAVVGLPYLMISVTIIAFVLFGMAHRVGQIPYVDTILRLMQTFHR